MHDQMIIIIDMFWDYLLSFLLILWPSLKIFSEQTILDSPVNTLWLNITSEPVVFFDIFTRYPIFLRIFGYMTPSIECVYDVLMSRSDEEDTCSHILWFCLWVLFLFAWPPARAV